VLALDYLLEGGSLIAKVRIALPETGWHAGRCAWKTDRPPGLRPQFPDHRGVPHPATTRKPTARPYHDAMSSDGSGSSTIPSRGETRRAGSIRPGPAWAGTTCMPRSGRLVHAADRNKDAYHIWMTIQQRPGRPGHALQFSRMLVVDPEGPGRRFLRHRLAPGGLASLRRLLRQWARTWLKKVDHPEWVRKADGWTIVRETVASRYITHAWPSMECFGAKLTAQNLAGGGTGLPSVFAPPLHQSAPRHGRGTSVGRTDDARNARVVQHVLL